MMMTTRAILFVILSVCLTIATKAEAAENSNQYFTVRVEVYSMDYAKRSLIANGYRYNFGFPGSPGGATVVMLGSQFGAFELLQKGMKLEITCRIGDKGRDVILALQIPDDTELFSGGLIYGP